MEYQKKEIRIFQNGRTVNDQFYIDGDYNVPEANRENWSSKFSIWQMRWFRYRQAWKGGSHLKR